MRSAPEQGRPTAAVRCPRLRGLGFFEAASQIIPILLLVVAVESGLFRRATTLLERVLALGAFVFVAWGEFTALRVLETERFGWLERSTVWAALAVLGAFVAISPRVWGSQGPPMPLASSLPATDDDQEASAGRRDDDPP